MFTQGRRATRHVATVVMIAAAMAASSWAGDSVYGAGRFELGDGNPPPGFPGAADILQDADQPGPDWGEIFDASGAPRPDVIASYGGNWALFVADDVSLGGGFESTALAGSDDSVMNGVASNDHDLGNAYVYTTVDSLGNLLVYAGIERLGGGDSYLEIELNQAKHRLGHGGYGHGIPWRVDGERMNGDVIVRISFVDGAVAAMDVGAWAQAGWQVLGSVPGEGCDNQELACVITNDTIIDGGPWPNFDTSDNPEEIAVSRFVELGVNVGGLIGVQPQFDTVQIRTLEDIAFGYFGEGY